MKRRHYVHSIVLLCLLAGSCTKKTFEALKQPATLIKLNAGEKINLIQEPLKDGIVIWDSSIENLDVEGLLRIVAGKQSYFFWQIKCPAELKCNGDKVYLPVVSTISYDLAKVPFASEQPPAQNIQAFLVDSERVYIALATVKFIADFKSPRPEKVIEPQFDAYLKTLNPRSKEASDLLLKLYLLASLATEKSAGDEIPAGFRQVPEGLRKSIQALAPKQTDGKTIEPFLVGLKDYTNRKYAEFLEEETKAFPLNGKTYKALAQNYKGLNKFPGLREKILIKIFAERVFSYETGDSKGPDKTAPDFEKALGVSVDAWTLEQKTPEECLTFSLPNHRHEFCAQILQAEADKKGLRFLLHLEPKSENTKQALGSVTASPQTDENLSTPAVTSSFHIWLMPNETSVYIEGIKKFERDIADMKKQITDSDFEHGINHRSLLEFAVKFGEGGYDINSGEYNFAITLKKGKPYNTFLKMTKVMVGAGPDEYSGDLPESFTKDMPQYAGSSEYRVRWFQSAKDGFYEFGLTGAVDTVYRSNRHSEKISETCFTGDSVIHVSFKTDNLSTGLPEKVAVTFPTEGGLCNKILNPKE